MATDPISERLSFLSGSRRKPLPKMWAVTGTNVRGEHFTITYRTRRDAADYAEEINGKGGAVKVVKM